MEKIGIVILNYITWQETQRCICSVREAEPEKAIQIYVVDNASPEVESIRRVCERDEVVLICNQENLGYAAGNNVGIAKALEDGCDYILISNNDILFHPGSISKMCEYLKIHSEYGIVAPKVLEQNGSIQRRHFKKMPSYRDIWLTQTVLRYCIKKPLDVLYGAATFYEEEQDLFAACGCCFLMSAECAEKVTPLDEMTFLYEEENILGTRMEKAGIKTAYLPNCQVTHNHDQTTRLVKPFALICWTCSEIYYCREYLGICWWKIYILYWYRVLIFFIHGVKDKEYRQQWNNFRKETKKLIRTLKSK